jgi:hypothetical protein
MASRAVKVTGSRRQNSGRGRPRKKLEDQRWYEVGRFFILKRSERTKGRDGQYVDMPYRIGPSGGAFTIDDLLEKTGRLAKLVRYEKQLIKDGYAPDSKAFKTLKAAYRAKLVQEVGNSIHSFCRRVALDMAANGFVPLAGKVRIHSEDEKPRFYIQGYWKPDARGEKLVIGSRDDAALWAIETKSKNETQAHKHALSMSVGRDLISRGLLTGPVKERLAIAFKRSS